MLRQGDRYDYSDTRLRHLACATRLVTDSLRLKLVTCLEYQTSIVRTMEASYASVPLAINESGGKAGIVSRNGEASGV